MPLYFDRIPDPTVAEFPVERLVPPCSGCSPPAVSGLFSALHRTGVWIRNDAQQRRLGRFCAAVLCDIPCQCHVYPPPGRFDLHNVGVDWPRSVRDRGIVSVQNTNLSGKGSDGAGFRRSGC